MTDNVTTLNPASWHIELDPELLRARSISEWRKAHALAKALALRWVRTLGGDVDDIVQEALTALDAELDKLVDRGVAPSCALYRVFLCKAANAQRARGARDRLVVRLAAQRSPEAPRPDSELEQRRLATAYETVLASELSSADPIDREILLGTLSGQSGKELASSIGLVESTISYRKSRIVQRLRARLRSALDDNRPSSSTPTEHEVP